MLMPLVQILNGAIYKLKSLGKTSRANDFIDITFVNVHYFILFKY